MNIKFPLTLSFCIGLSVICISAPPSPNGNGGGNGNQNGNGWGNGGNGGNNNGGGAPNGGQPCWPPPCIPIDGGISLLIAAGAIYSYRKTHSKHKE